MSKEPQREPIQRVFLSRTQTKAYYDKISRVYDLLADRTEAPVRKAGFDMLAPQPAEKILEIGFGTGHILQALAEAVGPSGKVYGIDLSERMKALAEKRLAEHSLLERVELICGDALNMPYPDGSMDGIYMSFTLELFDTPEIPRLLQECHRVLNKTGRLLVVGMSKEQEERDFMVRAFEWTHHHFPNFLDCRPIYVSRAVESAGFKVKEAKMMHMWVPVELVLATKE